MCRTSCGRTVLVGALSVIAGQAWAQSIQAYERRVDSMAAVFRAASAARLAYEETLALSYARFDTVSAGPIRVLTIGGARPFAEQGARQALARLQPQYGRALEQLAHHVFVVREVRDSDLVAPGKSASYLLVATLDERGREDRPQTIRQDADIVANVLTSVALGILLRSADPAVTGWAHSTLPADTGSSEKWPRVRVDLLSSPATVARRCYDFDLRACRRALGILPSPDPVLDWFTPDDRRLFIERIANRRWRAVETRLASACTSGRDMACVTLLRDLSPLPDPLATYHRTGLLELAMSVGGERSMERFLTTPGGVEERLASAARVNGDSLLRLWVGRVRDVRTPSDDMSLAVAASSLGWILVCGALALRSSRWR